MKKKRKSSILMRMRQWHRILGISIVVLVINISITGILLNHGESLALDSRYISSKILLKLYGIKLPQNRVSFHLGNSWITQMGTHLFFNDKEVLEIEEDIIGVVSLQYHIIATKTSLLLLTQTGEILEKLQTGIPENITRIGKRKDYHLILETQKGYFQSDQELFFWEETTLGEVQWAYSSTMPIEIEKAIRHLYLGKGLSWERIILDLHSGKLVGSWGKFLADIAAIGMLILSLSGLFIYFGHQKNKKK